MVCKILSFPNASVSKYLSINIPNFQSRKLQICVRPNPALWLFPSLSGKYVDFIFENF